MRALTVACLLVGLGRLCAAQTIGEAVARDFKNPLVRIECVAAHEEDGEIVVDSLAAQPYVSTCEGYQGAIAFVRDTTVSEANVEFLNRLVLRGRPDFLIMCGTTRAEGPIWCSTQDQ